MKCVTQAVLVPAAHFAGFTGYAGWHARHTALLPRLVL